MRGKLFNDKQLIDGFINKGKTKEIEYLYKSVKTKVKKFILNNGGLVDEVDDAFHNGLLNVFVKIKEEKNNLIINIESYLFISCKNAWLTERIKKDKEKKEKSEYLYIKNIDNIVEPNNKVSKKIFKALKELPNDCKKIFILQRKGYSYADISENFGITIKSLKTKRARCIKQLNNILTTNNNGK